MNEETTTPEAVELDTDIVKETLVDAENNNTELDIKTRFITRLRMTPLNVKVPLYVNGVLKSPETLAKLGLTIRKYTRLEVEIKLYGNYYAANPDLAPRVRKYKGYLDRLGLEYTATTDDISAAIQGDATLSETEKLQLAQEVKAEFDNIALNFEALGIEGASYEAWRTMSKLIRFLPEENTEEQPSEV